MKIQFSPEAFDDLLHWVTIGEHRTFRKIHRLITDIQRDPENPGLGKPERLKAPLAGWLSRRITQEDRLVYRIEGDTLLVISARGHY
ncbi:Txe/YoeB family addiction module toxin [Kineosporia babensis]|uniref:Endoribonuclease YoeB n=1 Tax=Kineosporia babensis TaxID=499548 RepID=A0A9X1NCH1_9ACTN|nr:Txe/YoeB family addiction module toxin [Kineosporia babensis]MCD5312427.1 Txe/YoeB family addiction module toxin [Kineosporia babensis]